MKLSSNEKTDYEFDVALSFAGEDRWYVDVVARELKNNQVKVFYDKYEKVDLWGKYLPDNLYEIYANKALYCVIFISRDYVEKVWTNVERRGALSRAIRQREEYILPARLSHGEITGLEDVSYIDLMEYSCYEFAALIIAKLQMSDNNNLKERLKDYIPKSEKFNYILEWPEISILEGFDNSRFRYRAINKILQESGEEKEIVRKRLLFLKDKGLVDIINRSVGSKWIITIKGKEYLDYYYHELDESSG